GVGNDGKSRRVSVTLHEYVRRETGEVLIARNDQQRHFKPRQLISQIEDRSPLLLHAELRKGGAFGRMLGEPIGEFRPAARLLRLELHTRRADGVAGRKPIRAISPE